MIQYKTRIILAGALGNLIESFDMAICGLLFFYLSRDIIANTATGIFLLFLTFFAGYLARPIGAIVMGLLSDKYGRKMILAASILSMGVTTACIGLIPSHSVLGISSVYILLILRIIQSFSCGAEYLNSSAYLIENAEENKKGYSGSWASFGAMAGLTTASIAALMVFYFNKTYPDFDWFIWRIPFILALLGSSIGLYIRLCIPESMEYIIYYSERPQPEFSNLWKMSCNFIKNNKLQSLYVFLLSCLGVTTTFQIYIYGPMQAHLSGNFTDQEIMISNIFSLIILLSLFPLMGKLSDRINREKIVISACLGFLLLSQLFFYSLSNQYIYQLVLCQTLIAIPAAAYYATVPVMLAEMFPINLRCTVLSVLYSIAASLSAGLAPLISLLLLKKLEHPSSPSIITIILVVLIFIVMSLKYTEQDSKKYVNAG
jgi:MHS family proline/betaine transporter-like MFS transporter